jgi:hopanoid C-3 methylase
MSKLRILFCTAPYHSYNLADEKVYVVEPLQFEVLSSLLDKELFDVQCLDLRLERRRGSLRRKLASFRPHVLGMTSWTMHVDLTKEAFRIAKAQDPAIITMVGGEHTRIAPWDFATPETDFIVMGEGYQTFSALMNSVREGSDGYRELDGVAFQKDGAFHSNGQAIVPTHFDLDRLPFPDRQITAPYHGRYYHLWWKPIVTIRTAMGCPSRCSFCNLWKVNLGKYLQWSPEYIVDQLSRLDAHYVLIVDDHFFGDIRRAYAIGNAILKSGIRKEYCLYSRADAISHHPEIVELWSHIGLKRVRMGLESFSDRTLDTMHKCQSVEHNDTAIRVLKRYGVLTEGLFQVGLDFSARDFEEMLHYIRSRQIEVSNITISTPMPGTDDYALHARDILYRTAEYYDFQHAVLPTRLDLKTYCREYSNLMFRAQLPPREQIRLIGLKTFLLKMPNFWRYFWSLRTSYKHYGTPQRRSPERDSYSSQPSSLPWIERSHRDDARGRQLNSVQDLYVLNPGCTDH